MNFKTLIAVIPKLLNQQCMFDPERVASAAQLMLSQPYIIIFIHVRTFSADCPDGQVSCVGNKSMCIPEQYVCDGSPNCQDYSDENFCRKTVM